jgi:hypothetical protein
MRRTDSRDLRKAGPVARSVGLPGPTLTFATFFGFNATIRFADIVETASADRAASRAGHDAEKCFCGFRHHDPKQ